MPAKGLRRYAWVAAPVAALAIVAGVRLLATGGPGDDAASAQVAGASATSSVTAARAAFSGAVQAMQSAGSPPSTYTRGALAAVAAKKPVLPVDAATRARLLADGRHELARYFTPELAKAKELGLRNMLAMDADPNQVNLGAGVSAVKFLSTQVSGNTATIEADVTAWARSKVRQAPKSPWLDTAPVSTMRFVGQLRKAADGRWLVTSLRGDFSAGNAP